MDESYYHINAEHDFARARRRATLASLFSFATGSRDELISLDEARHVLRPTSEAFRGVQVIEVARIIGSEGRYSDFNQRFLPRREAVSHRWRRVHMAHQKEIGLPAILVYELGGYYFIRDGNHRVSVAVQLGRTFMEAQVTSLETEIELGEVTSIDDLRRAVLDYEHEQFAKSLNELDLAGDIRFTATGRFDDLAIHIACHRKAVENTSGTHLDYEEATRSWYRTVYLPITQLIRDSHVLDFATDRTEADFYVWLVRHWEAIAHPAGTTYKPNRRLRRGFRRQVG